MGNDIGETYSQKKFGYWVLRSFLKVVFDDFEDEHFRKAIYFQVNFQKSLFESQTDLLKVGGLTAQNSLVAKAIHFLELFSKRTDIARRKEQLV